jgi:hypothetical protein
MARDLQNLCIETLDEYDIGGGSSGFTVATTNPEHKRLLKWMIAADMFINNLHTDWRFLWVDWTGPTLAASSDTIPAPAAADVNQWMLDQMWLDRETTDPVPLAFVEWQSFRRDFRSNAVQAGTPQFYSIAPDGTIYLDSSTLKTMTPSGQYHRQTPELVNDADVPLVPSNHRRIIQVKAVLNYSIREDAPEILSGEAAEYEDLLETLELAEWPGARTSGYGENEDLVVVVE